MHLKFVKVRLASAGSAAAETQLVSFTSVQLATIKPPLRCVARMFALPRNAVVKIHPVLIMNAQTIIFRLPLTHAAVKNALRKSVARKGQQLQLQRASSITVMITSVQQATRRTCGETLVTGEHARILSAVTSRW